MGTCSFRIPFYLIYVLEQQFGIMFLKSQRSRKVPRYHLQKTAQSSLFKTEYLGCYVSIHHTIRDDESLSSLAFSLIPFNIETKGSLCCMYWRNNDLLPGLEQILVR